MKKDTGVLILIEYTMRAGAISICSHIVFILFY
mgnify:CR=1 FL=1